MRLGIIDLGLGNIESVLKLFYRFDWLEVIRITQNDFLERKIDVLVLPGVSSAGALLDVIHLRGFDRTIAKFSSDSGLLIGICSGFQALTRGTDEGFVKGLGILPFETVRLSKFNIGWSEVVMRDDQSESVGLGLDLFFCNRFGVLASNARQENFRPLGLGFSSVGDEEIISYLQVGNVAGLQCHPEKSYANGEIILNKIFGSWGIV